jgi:hypothetical protein
LYSVLQPPDIKADSFLALTNIKANLLKLENKAENVTNIINANWDLSGEQGRQYLQDIFSMPIRPFPIFLHHSTADYCCRPLYLLDRFGKYLFLKTKADKT